MKEIKYSNIKKRNSINSHNAEKLKNNIELLSQQWNAKLESIHFIV